MLKRLARAKPLPWICQQCQWQKQRPRRLNSTLAASSVHARDSPALPQEAAALYGLSASGKTDDEALRKVFDNSAFWDSFRRSSSARQEKPAGIIGNKYLTHPEGFVDFVSITIQRCNAVVQKVSAAQSTEELRNIVKDLDKLSDLLCRVIDLADFVRGTHPDRKFQTMAVKAYHTLFQYMNELNTTPVLYDQLKRASEMAEVYGVWTEEERIVARILMEDFSRFGIGLDEKTRQRLVDLSGEIAEVGSQFVEGMAPETPTLRFKAQKLKGLDPNLAKSLTNWGETRISTMHHEAQSILRFVQDPDVRRETYMAVRTASKPSIARLEKMLKLRAELAQSSGYETFAHMTLENKMARTPEAVNTFLNALYEDSRPGVLADLNELIDLKKSDAHQDNFPNRINAWDKFYYTQKLLATLENQSRIRSADPLSAYFSVGTVLQGISRLFDRLYGVRFVPKETQPGEVWHPGVRRLDVVSDTEGHIAVLYCDLYSRPGKTPNPAHFTLRCSREILPSELAEMSHMQHRFSSPIEAATDGMPVTFNAERGSYFQLPTIALVCDFSASSAGRPTLLNIHDVRTLFHEMGHALHSILGRTCLQNVSGTRCATDIAELPSVLMEHFAFCPHVLRLYARHWETDAPVPMAALEKRLAVDNRSAAAELESQILLCMLDQVYHSALPAHPNFDSTATYHDIYNRYASVPEPAGTAWQGFFGHLFGYGATYYSYLFDRVLAARIWEHVFQRDGAEGSLDRRNGELYKEEVLKWGGGRDGWQCLAGVLGEGKLKEGGEVAMREVGRWGVRDGK
ncbi:Mitochondrial intermediate peptidase [Plenodomus lingam]|uniref:Mitochondrial intermediate peptidase n=1 Tax=Leptosphaeria maculans (strain JN3 / isolate v23.1.3 / race Av1-4-5-6-7-8) TaxID=985895 RepID=E5A3B5_LEPMJ|nr:similar to mitochondrial intermediate peptidase mitochondrial precursor [Plenodomus lingam JN3]KAH9862030.1 Mitochondrial intermediate peptidase [Plenodomus lingam]CBX98128.1 similar to mitochondrial intermediate peptidase mitochondrial precursor [Plenodomus lingam JN3]